MPTGGVPSPPVEDLTSAATRLPFGGQREDRPSAGPPGIHGRRAIVRRGRPTGVPASPTVRTVRPRPLPRRTVDLIRRLVDIGRCAATVAGYDTIVETAAGSESTYLHVKRDGWWFGIRVSTHAAVYGCSIDYDQITVPRVEDASESDQGWDRFDEVASVLRANAVTGGSVVADPIHVRQQILRAEMDAADRSTHIDEQGEFRFDSATATWHRVQGEGQPPGFVPRGVLNTAATAAIRHRENAREKFAAAELGIAARHTGVGQRLWSPD